ncbi:uncharacterized protein LOC100164913 isoform X1 [Acyrthosiphon pisum]|uniref:Uncharacterized protein n=1 Tax=Acyrthosiphon pisum TaxID=7029 RepID=A0A8R2B4W9_ACYPI|nr:uncharacterized protein LOC100164913 isoform X1 [Acyrthosiphon pisum]|eukprot:XP_008181844.1 PREDICTED: uncharacterized protein LOC100164913 isoform X1 [Acyrthosiphon pisum]
MSKTIAVMTLIVYTVLYSQKNAFYADAAPSITRDDLTAVLPRSLAELVDSDAFEQIWRKAATDEMVKRFGNGAGRDDGAVTRNMIGDYMVSDEFHKAVCKAGGSGMSAMGGMMGKAPPPWSYMGTFIGSDKFQHGSCDMVSQGLIQFGDGMNGWFRSAGADADTTVVTRDPLRAVDVFFRSEYYGDARKNLRDMFADVRF